MQIESDNPLAPGKCPVCELAAQGPTQMAGKDMWRYTCERCGKYNLSEEAGFEIKDKKFEPKRHLLSGVLRTSWENGQEIALMTYNLDEVVHRAPTNPRVTSLLEQLLVFVADRSRLVSLHGPTLVPETAYPLFYLRNGTDLIYLAQLLTKQGLLEQVAQSNTGMPVRLTPLGWERAEQLQQTRGRPDQAFVAMSFHESMSSAYTEGIKPALERTGYTPIRVDRIEHNDKIDDLILSEIRRSGLVIADFSLHRQGVYFEAGFALGLGIPVVWTCRKEEMKDAHFDTRQYNHIDWADVPDLRDRLERRIRASGYARAESS